MLPYSILIFCMTVYFYSKIYDSTYILLLPLLYFIQIYCVKLMTPGIKIRQLLYIFCLLFLTNTILISSISFFLSDSTRNIIELCTHILLLILCAICCYTKINAKIKTIISFTTATTKYLLMLILIVGILLIVCSQAIYKIPNIADTSRFEGLFQLTLILLFVFIAVLFPVIIFISVSNKYFKTLTENYEEQIKAQAEHYAALSKANFELRRFRHDFNNIRIGVSELITQGRYQEALSTLDTSNTEIYKTSGSLLIFDTGNGIVDALLADKQQKAAASNIKIIFDGAIPQDVIASTELCILFGNTVDNAIEACEKLTNDSDKIISIKCQCNSGFMFLKISNPVSEPVKIYNNTLSTTKADKNMHGFGLYSLDKTVKKRNGELELCCDDSMFEVKISLCVV